MSLSVTVQKMRNKLWKFEGEVIVNSQKMSECEFSAMMRFLEWVLLKPFLNNVKWGSNFFNLSVIIMMD